MISYMLICRIYSHNSTALIIYKPKKKNSPNETFSPNEIHSPTKTVLLPISMCYFIFRNQVDTE